MPLYLPGKKPCQPKRSHPVKIYGTKIMVKFTPMAIRQFALFVLIVLACPTTSKAQTPDLRQDKAFFRQKRLDFNQWLWQNKLHTIFRADSVEASAGKVTLYIRPVYKGAHVCDSLQCAWDKLERANQRVNGQYFHERLLHKWAFLAEVRPDQAEVVVRCHDPAHFLAIANSQNAEVTYAGRNIRGAQVADVPVPMPAQLQAVNTGDNKMLVANKQVGTLCSDARRYLIKYYQSKGTPILWRARVDSSYTTYDEFILEVTHLNYEICPDGFFEYHRIYIKGVQNGPNVEVSWEFQGKYGSGIIFPPRKNDYKDMEGKYKNNLEEYQRRLFKQLMDYLRR